MITASHNPHEYNGIKIIVEKGKDAPVTVTDELERIANSIDGKLARRNFFEYINEEKIVYYENKNEYIDSLLAFIDTGCIKNRSFKILFNPMYGVSKDIMLMCLASLRCYVDLMNAYRDTMFGLKLPSPERKSLLDMEYKMKEKKYDMGIATDGDSDRIGIYDENGNYIDANKILVLLYYYLLKYKGMKGGVVRNLTTTHTLDKIAEKFGERAFEVPVGFKYISEKMEEYDLLLGGESSGGLKIRGHVNGKDGILAALLMVEMVCKTGKTIGALLKEIEDEFGKKYFKMENIKITNKELLKKRFFEDKYVPEIGKKVKRISYMDGLKIYYDDDTWLSIRFSGTEPVLRITCEMNSEDEAANVIERIISVMR
jgi:phosphomannomutase